jgi:hypothetical protein
MMIKAIGVSYDPDQPFLDITGPEQEIRIEADLRRGILYVHVGPITVLRICRAELIKLGRGLKPPHS